MVNESLLNKAAEAKNITAETSLEKFQKVTGFVHEDHAQNLMTGVDADWYIPAGAYLPEDDNNEEPVVEPEPTPTPEEVEEHKGEEVTEENEKFDIDKDGDIDDDDVAQSELNIQGATGAQDATGAQGVTGPGE